MLEDVRRTSPATCRPSASTRGTRGCRITVGCNNFCTYCIVPYVRGRERSRPLEDIVAEVRAPRRPTASSRSRCSARTSTPTAATSTASRGSPRCCRRVAATGIERIRFATSHPKDLSRRDDRRHGRDARGHARTCTCRSSPGRTASSRRMNRALHAGDYLALVERLYAAMPDLALSTDIIVGFPGETEADFADTLDVVGRSASTRPSRSSTRRARARRPRMYRQVPRDVVQGRFDRLVEVVHASALAKNQRARRHRARGPRRGPASATTAHLAGRTDPNKVVHVPCPAGRIGRASSRGRSSTCASTTRRRGSSRDAAGIRVKGAAET